MTASTIADRSTQLWGDAALGPNGFDETSVLSEDQKRERRLYKDSPELEHLADAEWVTVQRWLAFKMSDHFVGQIYHGEPLDIASSDAVENYIAPEAKILQARYLMESAHIVGTHIPSIEKRIKEYQSRAKELTESAEYTQLLIDNGDLSPKLVLNLASWRKQAKDMNYDVSNLTADLPNLHMGAKVKDAMFYKINDFTSRISNGEQSEAVDAIVHEGKKIALEQAIIQFKSDRASVDNESDDGQTIIRGYDKAIELLGIELLALQDVSVDDINTTPSPQQRTDSQTVRQETTFDRESPLTRFRQKLLGSFSSKAASLYGAFSR